MSELVTIYKAQPDNVSEIIQLLESRGLHPVVADDIDKMGTYGSHQVRIAVPEIERDTAINIIEQFEQQDNSRISGLVKSTNKIVLIAIALLALATIAVFFDEKGKWSFIVWILIVAFVGVVLIRLAWSGKSHDPEK